MGPTGAGKSTVWFRCRMLSFTLCNFGLQFINYLFGENVAGVGKSLSSCTVDLQVLYYPQNSGQEGRIVIVDTPGFDDTYKGDEEILRKIADWLEKSYVSFRRQ